MKQATKTLVARKSALANAPAQRDFLVSGFGSNRLPKFEDTLKRSHLEVTVTSLDTLQINVGYKCNQTCTHCHVDAGPDRTEVMTKQTMNSCLEFLEKEKVKTLDITGGAPELNPDFKWLISHARSLVDEIIVRSNLTVIESHSRFQSLPEFFKEHGVRVVSSLPCYTKSNTDRQRGTGVFESSIKALQRLNRVGYGSDSKLKLDLVYNPGGAFLPDEQHSLQSVYKKRLMEDFEIRFDELLTITNLPISRFLDSLIAKGQYEQYMELLVNSFNPSTIDGLMCRNTLSVDWTGRLFDCDFNQMLNMQMEGMEEPHISKFNVAEWQAHKIRLSQHCYGCTAGAGSSCQGSIN